MTTCRVWGSQPRGSLGQEQSRRANSKAGVPEAEQKSPACSRDFKGCMLEGLGRWIAEEVRAAGEGEAPRIVRDSPGTARAPAFTE